MKQISISFSSFLVIFSFSFFISFVYCDFSIFGRIADSEELIDAVTQKRSYSTCYNGFGYTRCTARQADDDTVYSNTLPYYRNFELLRGLNYCLQCCSENHSPDVWDLECLQYTDVGPNIKIYGYELRMARMLTPEDTEIIRCPIKRSACTYNESDPLKVVECVDDDTSLWGIKVEFWITIRSRNFESWRTVESCNVTVDERDTPLENLADFTEYYVLNFTHEPQAMSTFDGSLYFLLFISLIYIILYYFRRERCLVCNKKLIIFRTRCYLCRFYGADPPDPLLIKAMDEKGSYLQGQYPPKFPGLKTCYSFWHGLYRFGKCLINSVVMFVRGVRYLFNLICCCQCFRICAKSKCCSCCCRCCGCRKDQPIDVVDEKKDPTIEDPEDMDREEPQDDPENYPSKSLPLNRMPSQGVLQSTSKKLNASMSFASSSNPTAPGGIKAPKKPKKNPHLLHVHPYFVYKGIDHPNPPKPPKWVQERRLAYDDEEEEDLISVNSVRKFSSK